MVTRLIKRRGPDGQTTAEYAVVIGVVIAAVVAMQVYVKRGLQAKVKGVADNLTQQGADTAKTKQYEPYYTESTYEVTQDRGSTDKVVTGGAVSRTGITETTERTGSGKTLAPE